MRPMLALLSLATAFSLTAQDAGTVKVAVLLPDRIITNSVHGHKLFSELDVLKKNLEEKLQSKGREIQDLEAKLQSPSVSDTGKETLTKQLRDAQYEGKKMQEDAETDYRAKFQKVSNQFQTEIGPIVQEVAKEQKLQLVITNQQGLIAFADPTWIQAFTDEVSKRYDAKYETAGAAAPAKPAAAKPAAKAKN